MSDIPRAAGIILNGMKGPIQVNGVEYNQPMPANPKLNQTEVLEILTYITNSWGNEYGGVAPELIKNKTIVQFAIGLLALYNWLCLRTHSYLSSLLFQFQSTDRKLELTAPFMRGLRFLLSQTLAILQLKFVKLIEEAERLEIVLDTVKMDSYLKFLLLKKKFKQAPTFSIQTKAFLSWKAVFQMEKGWCLGQF